MTAQYEQMACGVHYNVWPPESVLSKYGLSGLTAPEGICAVTHVEVCESGMSLLTINFIDATPPVPSSYFTGRFAGWFNYEGMYVNMTTGATASYIVSGGTRSFKCQRG